MADPSTYGPPTSEAEVTQAVEITSRAFGRVPWANSTLFERWGCENQRILREKGDVVASLILIPMGQWFGGRSVPMVGVGSVVVAPERWGRGFGSRLMREAVRELHRTGTALSALIPAIFSVYRAVGYEPAGTRGRVSIPAGRIGLADHALDLRPIEERDEEAIFEVQREDARRFPGHLDRNRFIWQELLYQGGRKADGSLVEVDGRIEGYLFSVPQILPEMKIHLHVVDLVALTARAGRRLLTFLHDHRSQFEMVHWHGDPADPLLSLLPEPTYRVQHSEPWMLRVIDVPAALSARGYPEGLEAELHLSVRDPLIPENDGPFLLEVSGGLGRAKRGGAGRIQLDVRGLAPLYTGHLPPVALRAAGLLDAPEEDLRCAAAVFAGPAPWFTETF